MRDLRSARSVPRRPVRVTVRTRILAALLALSALGLVSAGVTAYALQRARVDHRIDESLAQSAAELEQLAASGVSPVTGEPFASAQDVVVAAMQLTVPASSAGILGLRADRKPLVSGQELPLRLEDDAELVRAVSPAVDDDAVVLRSVTTSRSTYRVLVAPVRVTTQTASVPTAAAAPPAALVLAYDRDREHAVFDSVFRTYALVACGALVVIAGVGWLVSGRLLRPIRALARTAQRTGETDLSARIEVSGNDDLSDLGRSFNGMLSRLEASFGTQRRLLDDVGHELRTPLTIVQGHLELLDPTDLQDVTATRELALDELARMNRIVDDLMTLASVEQPDFVRPAETDVGRLTDDVLDKARQLGERTWTVSSRADVEARLDAQRITQAWLQLAANAVRFSAPGTSVTLGSRLDGERHLRLWVRDEGCGVPPRDRERIFERFARGAARDHGSGPREPAREEAAPKDGVVTTDGGTGTAAGPADEPRGTGLGLPIVAAIAQAHGGTVSVDSTVGVGSTFTIVLPVGGVPEGTPSPPEECP